MDDNRSRQSAEIVLVQSMYPSEFNWREREPDLKEPDCPDPVFSLALHRKYAFCKHSLFLPCSGFSLRGNESHSSPSGSR